MTVGRETIGWACITNRFMLCRVSSAVCVIVSCVLTQRMKQHTGQTVCGETQEGLCGMCVHVCRTASLSIHEKKSLWTSVWWEIQSITDEQEQWKYLLEPSEGRKHCMIILADMGPVDDWYGISWYDSIHLLTIRDYAIILMLRSDYYISFSRKHTCGHPIFTIQPNGSYTDTNSVWIDNRPIMTLAFWVFSVRFDTWLFPHLNVTNNGFYTENKIRPLLLNMNCCFTRHVSIFLLTSKIF